MAKQHLGGISQGYVLALLVMLSLVAGAQAQTFTVLHNFTESPDGSNPYNGGLVQDAAGNSYGNTKAGGSSDDGVVFKVSKTGKETVLHSFTGTDGAQSYGTLIRDRAGHLYGVAYEGGGNGSGVAFQIDDTGKETVLYNFCSLTNCADGGFPVGGLVEVGGKLYGTTPNGGDYECDSGNCGVVFQLDKSGEETVLHNFEGEDGALPQTDLILGGDGFLYGVTANGGDTNCNPTGLSPGCGVVFKVDLSGSYSVLYKFAGTTDGAFPYGKLTKDSAGNLYGTTFSGGDTSCNSTGTPPGCGVVFKLDKSNKETMLHKFEGEDGLFPVAGVILDAKGNLYGGTLYGGASNYGTLYELNKKGTLTVLHSFTGSNGENPYGGVIRDAKGNIYGTAFAGGSSGDGCGGNGCGVVWKLTA
jgi:uncharacterized repeat protein (TIGR03803 family)